MAKCRRCLPATCPPCPAEWGQSDCTAGWPGPHGRWSLGPTDKVTHFIKRCKKKTHLKLTNSHLESVLPHTWKYQRCAWRQAEGGRWGKGWGTRMRHTWMCGNSGIESGRSALEVAPKTPQKGRFQHELTKKRHSSRRVMCGMSVSTYEWFAAPLWMSVKLQASCQ